MNEYRTPMIASVIHYATFNPYWDVPHHLVRKTLAPAVIKFGPGALKAKGYEVMSDWTDKATVVPASEVDWKAVLAGTTQIRVRQLPGTENSMGKVKYPFPNGEGVYLHDTPHKEYFLKAQRALSNGCIRLEDATRFGRWLLGRDAVAPSPAPEQFVTLPQGMPIVVTYLTAQVSGQELTYVKDFYGLDGGSATKVATAG
jgi:murein L,D-transpeptidase YcbB/YkuD